MARIRSIKPEFWSDARLALELSRDARLLYIALWNEADDAGRFQAHPARLRGVVFPYDSDIQVQLIEDSLRTLSDTGRAVLYEVDGEPYCQLTKFAEHQKINRPTPSRLPAPPNTSTPPTIQGSLTEDSVSPHGDVKKSVALARAPRELGSGSGKGSGETETFANANGAGAPQSYPQKDVETDGGLMGLVRHNLYVEKKPPTGRTEDQDMNTIRTLLRRGVPPPDLVAAIYGAAAMRDDNQLADFAPPGTSLSMGILAKRPRNGDYEIVPYFTVAVHYWHKKLEAGGPKGDTPARVQINIVP